MQTELDIGHYIGVDNGVSGGLAAIGAVGHLIAAIPMPVMRARKGNEVDVRSVHTWMREVTGGNLSDAVYVIEEPGGSKSAKACASMAGSFHAIRSLFDAKMLRWHRVTPQQWQRTMLPGSKAGETKPRALAKARSLWPSESFLATARCSTPHDGMIDAALIAEWARLQGV